MANKSPQIIDETKEQRHPKGDVGVPQDKNREFKGPIDIFIKVVSALLCFYSLLYASQTLSMVRIIIDPSTHNAIFLSIILVLVFLQLPARKGSPGNRITWYDALLIAGSLPATVYFAISWQTLVLGKAWASTHEIILGLILLLTVTEATRRTVGWPVTIVVWFFFFYANFCYILPGLFHGPKLSLDRVMVYVYMSEEGLFGSILGLACEVIVVFMTFGIMISRAGVGGFFLDLALSLVGHIPGGPAKVAVISSGLFGTVSGSAVSNVVVTGSVTIPMMKKVGYKPHFAGAVEAVASTGGILMPPVMGAAAFILAQMTSRPYGVVCVAAVLPAVLYYLSVYMQVHFEAVKTGLKGLPPEEIPSFRKVLKEGWFYLIPVALLVMLLMVFLYDIIWSCIYSMAATVVVSIFRKGTRMGPKALIGVFQDGTKAMMTMVPICALIGVVTGSLMVTGLGLSLGVKVVELSGGSLLALSAFIAVLCYILGMGISSLASYMLVAMTAASAMVSLGVPMLAAHFFILYMTCSTFITPPYCMAAIVAAPIAGASAMKIGFQAMRLGIVCYIVPFVFVFSPGLLLGQGGTLLGSILIFIAAIIGVIWLSAGVEGYLLKPTNWVERILLIGAGLSMIVPEWKSSVIGLILGALVYLWQWRKDRLFILSRNAQGESRG